MTKDGERRAASALKAAEGSAKRLEGAAARAAKAEAK